MKIIKKLLILISFIFLLFVFNTAVQAAGISISTSKSTVKPGESFTVTVSVSNGAGYVSASVSNGSGGFGSTWLENGSKSFTCKAGNSGNVTIKTSGTVADFTTEKDESASRSKSVKIQAQTTTTKTTTSKTTTTKKTNNTSETTKKEETAKEESEKTEETNQEKEKYLLKSLEIEGEEVLPEFSSEVFEYTVNIKDKEQLNINTKANKEDLIVEIVGNENLQFGENTIIINLKGQDDKEITSYKINVIKEKSELTLANEKIQKLEKLNIIFIGIIALLIILIITIVIIYSVIIRKYKNKIDDTSIDSNKKEE